jgi:hypothetical protein
VTIEPKPADFGHAPVTNIVGITGRQRHIQMADIQCNYPLREDASRASQTTMAKHALLCNDKPVSIGYIGSVQR